MTMNLFFYYIRFIWEIMFGWMPLYLGIFCGIILGLLVVICILKLIAFIWDLLPLV